MMIKIIGVIALIAGAVLLILGVMGISGNMDTGISPWAFIILGAVFLYTGVSLLKHINDSDVLK